MCTCRSHVHVQVASALFMMLDSYLLTYLPTYLGGIGALYDARL